MKTISIQVSDDISEFDYEILKRKCEWLTSKDCIAIFWGIDDVKLAACHLSDDQARKVLQFADRRHDATVGINWDVLKSISDMLYDRPKAELNEA